MAVRRQVVTVTSIADGSATAFSPIISGRLCSISYVKTDYDNGVDFTITAEGSGETLWTEVDINASTTRYPRGPTHSTAGVAALYVAAGTAVFDKIAISRDRVKIVLAAAGNVKTGVFHIVVDG